MKSYEKYYFLFFLNKLCNKNISKNGLSNPLPAVSQIIPKIYIFSVPLFIDKIEGKGGTRNKYLPETLQTLLFCS